jgi:hypothetical protein
VQDFSHWFFVFEMCFCQLRSRNSSTNGWPSTPLERQNSSLASFLIN